MIRFGVCLFLCSLVVPNLAWPAPPVLNWVFPAGGNQGTTVQADLGGTFQEWPPTIWSNCKDVSMTPGQKPRVTFQIQPDAPPGPRLFRVTNKDGVSGLKCFWVGHIPEIDEKEPNDNYLKPQHIGAGPVVVNGRLNSPGDSDTFSLNVKKGQTIIARGQANQGLESPMDGVIQILSPDGFILVENHDRFGLDPFAQYTATADGVYRVRIFAFPAVPDTSIRLAGAETYIYRLTMTSGPYMDHPIPLAFTPGKENTFKMAGWNLSRDLPSLKISYPGNTEFAMIHGKGVAGCFQVPATKLPLITPSPQGTKTVLEGEAVVSGCLDLQKKHLFELKLPKGSKYRVTVHARQIGSDLDPVLTLKDSKGMEIKRADDENGGRDVSLEIPPQSDVFLLELFDLHRHFGGKYYYRMDLTLVKPDFEITMDADSFSSKDAKPVEIPLKVVRTGGHNQEIQISVQGLPNGWVADNLVIGAKTSSPVKLILKPNEKAEAGVVTIEAKSESIKKKVSRNLPSLESKVEQVFLFKENKEKK